MSALINWIISKISSSDISIEVQEEMKKKTKLTNYGDSIPKIDVIICHLTDCPIRRKQKIVNPSSYTFQLVLIINDENLIEFEENGLNFKNVIRNESGQSQRYCGKKFSLVDKNEITFSEKFHNKLCQYFTNWHTKNFNSMFCNSCHFVYGIIEIFEKTIYDVFGHSIGSLIDGKLLSKPKYILDVPELSNEKIIINNHADLLELEENSPGFEKNISSDEKLALFILHRNWWMQEKALGHVLDLPKFITHGKKEYDLRIPDNYFVFDL
jgi:hypothetical protein